MGTFLQRYGNERLGPALDLSGEGESAWRDVIQRMDEVYSDLLRYESDLERKNAELEEASSFISSVVASMSDILVVCDSLGRIIKANPAFQRLLGPQNACVVGQSLTQHLVIDDHAGALRLLGAEAKDQTLECELRFVTDAGPSDSFAVMFAARFDRRGRRVGAVLTGRPIGELKRAYAALHDAHVELQQAQSKLIEQEKMASLGRLVAGVAHELNNPISFVYGNIHCLDRYRKKLAAYFEEVDGCAGANVADARERHGVDHILDDLAPLIEGTLEGASRASEIVRNLRRLSFKAQGVAQDVDLERVVSTAANWAAGSKRSHARIVIDVEPGVVMRGDEGHIHQVALNLIDNALDAVRDVMDPEVRIRLVREGDNVVLQVSDNGKGIEEAALRQIFEPFFTTKPVGEGTGLGLWISYSIVTEHGGVIIGENSPGGGAIFTVRLPARLKGSEARAP